MVHSKGYRSGTRYKFAKAHKRHGVPMLARYLTTYKRGDYVNIKVDGAIHKGMPHHYYHGRTGKVFNISRRAVGVEMSKRVGNSIVLKRFHVRIEHVRKSRCREEFEKRREENDRRAREAAAAGQKIGPQKRVVAGPRSESMAMGKIIDISPLPFTESF